MAGDQQDPPPNVIDEDVRGVVAQHSRTETLFLSYLGLMCTLNGRGNYYQFDA